LGPEGLKTLREWRTDVAQQEWERRVNPTAFYRKLIAKEAQPVIQQSLQSVSQTYQSVQSAQQEVQKWMKDNSEVASPENIKAVLDFMGKGETFAMASARVERDHYRSLISHANKAKQSAEEKERILQGNAAGPIARNPKSVKKVDVKAVAKERGVKNHREFADLLFELDEQGQL
jgi:predicted phage tail protein